MIACLLSACNLSGNDVQIVPTEIRDASVQATLPPTPTTFPTLSPTPTPVSRFDLGDRAFFNGDWDMALEEYRRAFENHPDPEVQSAALLGLGRTYYEISDFAAALGALRRIPADYPDSPYLPETYFALAQVYEALDRFSEAVAAYDVYLDLRPGVIDSYIYEWRGDALTATGEYTAAIDTYQAAMTAP